MGSPGFRASAHGALLSIVNQYTSSPEKAFVWKTTHMFVIPFLMILTLVLSFGMNGSDGSGWGAGQSPLTHGIQDWRIGALEP